MSSQVAQDLRDAAKILRRDGWIQRTYGTVDGCKCIFGALHYVASDGEHVDESDMYWRDEDRANNAAEALAEYLGLEDYASIPIWNDAEDRTEEEVLGALEAAARETAPAEVDQ